MTSDLERATEMENDSRQETKPREIGSQAGASPSVVVYRRWLQELASVLDGLVDEYHLLNYATKILEVETKTQVVLDGLAPQIGALKYPSNGGWKLDVVTMGPEHDVKCVITDRSGDRWEIDLRVLLELMLWYNTRGRIRLWACPRCGTYRLRWDASPGIPVTTFDHVGDICSACFDLLMRWALPNGRPFFTHHAAAMGK